MEKQEFCMEKSQIFQEMISRISKLSQDSYLMVTDMQHNLTFVPESTAEFLGIPSGWCEDGYKIVLEKSVHPYDCPEYTEEMKKRLRGINLENDLYIRMGKDKKYVMTQIITDMILEQGKNRYFIVLLRNQNVIPEIDPLTDLYGQVKFEKDIVDYIQQGRKVAVLEIEIDHMNDINILYGTNYSDRIQKVLAYRFIYMMDADKAVYRMGNSNYAFILRDASREEAAAFLEKIRARLEESVVLENNHFDLKIYASGIILDHYEGEISTVQSKLEYVLGKMRTRRDHKLMFFNDLVQINGDVDLDLMKLIHQSVLNECDGFYLFANLSAVDFYDKCGFSKEMEYRYAVKEEFCGKKPTGEIFMPVNTADEQMKQKYMNMVRCSASNSSLEQLNKFGLQMFYTADMENVYYAKDLDCFIVAEMEEDTLLLQSIICENKVLLSDDLSRIGGKYHKCRLGFTPVQEDMHMCIAERYDGSDDYRLFYRGQEMESIEREKLYFPELSHA